MSFLCESEHEYTQYFEQYQVYRLLSSIKRTSSGCEPIPYWVYKHCAIKLTPIVTHIFNLTLSCGHPLAAWKHSIVTPIQRLTHRSNYQISALSLSLRFYLVASRNFSSNITFFPALPVSNLQDQFAFRPTGCTTNAFIHFLR